MGATQALRVENERLRDEAAELALALSQRTNENERLRAVRDDLNAAIDNHLRYEAEQRAQLAQWQRQYAQVRELCDRLQEHNKLAAEELAECARLLAAKP